MSTATAEIVTEAEITARKLASAARQYTGTGRTAQMEAGDPQAAADGTVTLKIWRDGRAYRVTVEDIGTDGD
jgi:hypothetical protein